MSITSTEARRYWTIHALDLLPSQTEAQARIVRMRGLEAA